MAEDDPITPSLPAVGHAVVVDLADTIRTTFLAQALINDAIKRAS